MNPPKEAALPSLLKVPELTATLEALGQALKEQDESLKAARASLSEKMVEVENLKHSQAEAASHPAASPEATIDEFREPFARAMAELSVMLWRIKQSIDKLGETKDTRRIQRDLATCEQTLKTLGIETVDRANADLNTGIYRDLEVISNEMTSEVTQVTVAEVLKPAVHFRVLHPLLRKSKERADQPPFIIQKCQVVTKSPPMPNA
jgi:chromosome segregation ATPase